MPARAIIKKCFEPDWRMAGFSLINFASGPNQAAAIYLFSKRPG
jgi:hypothetical protein